MSRIFKRGKIWWIDYEYKDRRMRYSLKTRSKRAAELKLKQIDIQIVREELNVVVPRRVSFSEFSSRFLRWYRVQNSEKAFKDYRNLFKSTIKPYFKEYYLNDIGTEIVEEYKIQRAETIKPASVNKELTALRHLFNKAIQWGYLAENPLRHVKKLKVSQRKFRFLSLEEIDLVLKNSPDYLRPIIITAIHTGLRKSELFRLEWSDVDLTNRRISVTAKEDEHTKNYKNRDIPMSIQLVECLSNLERKSSWVFSKKDGSRYSGWIRKSLESIAIKTGIQRFTMHDLRHTFASQLVMEGIDLPTVQRLMGHANISTTMIYAHLAPDHLKGAINRLSMRFVNGTKLAQWDSDTKN